LKQQWEPLTPVLPVVAGRTLDNRFVPTVFSRLLLLAADAFCWCCRYCWNFCLKSNAASEYGVWR
jgi:hypothetical protein